MKSRLTGRTFILSIAMIVKEVYDHQMFNPAEETKEARMHHMTLLILNVVLIVLSLLLTIVFGLIKIILTKRKHISNQHYLLCKYLLFILSDGLENIGWMQV